MFRFTFRTRLRRAFFLFGLLAQFTATLVSAQQRKPNVILILADDVSAREYSLYGGRGISTPALDQMAKGGIYFQTAWAAPVCGPARAMLYTGRYNQQTGLGSNEGIQLLPKLLQNTQIGAFMKDAGYATALFGKLHHAGNPQQHGFDEYAFYENWDGYTGKRQMEQASSGMYSVHWYWHPGIVANGKGIPTTTSDFGPEIMTRRMLEFISRHKDEPFFVFWPTNLPHHEFNDEGNKWVRPDVPVLDDNGQATSQRIDGSLKSNLEYLDGKLAQIRRHLVQIGIAEHTIIIFTADNGTAGFGKGKAETSIAVRVPLVIDGGGVPAIGARQELVDFTDFIPTFLELAGSPPSGTLDGLSLAPLLRGNPFQGRRYIQSHGALQFPPERKGDIGSWVRDDRWLLDANGDLWDCGKEHDERKFRKAALHSAEAQAALSRLKKAQNSCSIF